MTPTKEWLKLWMENREQLSCQQDLSEYFEQEEVAGCPVRTVRVGLCPVPVCRCRLSAAAIPGYSAGGELSVGTVYRFPAGRESGVCSCPPAL